MNFINYASIKAILLKVVIGIYLVIAILWVSETSAQTTKKVEYSRITSGGAQCESGRIKINDSITRTTGSVVQKSARFKVASVKNVSTSASCVKTWSVYK